MLMHNAPLVVLCYHGLTEETQAHLDDFCFVSVSKFASDLQKVRSLGWRFVRLAEGIQKLRLKALQHPSVAVTFDDGFASALKLSESALREAGAHATVFLPTQLVKFQTFPWYTQVLRAVSATEKNGFEFFGRKFSVSTEHQKKIANRRLQQFLKQLHPQAIPELLVELFRALGNGQVEEHPEHRVAGVDECVKAQAKGLFSFGAHSANHAIHSKLSLAELKREILESVSFVRDVFGDEPILYAYPNGQKGDFSNRCADLLWEQRVDSAFTTIEGWNRHCRDPFAFKRFCVGPQTNVGAILTSRKHALLSRWP